MSLKRWEKKVLEAPGAAKRVAEIEEELRLAAGLTALREEAGLSQRQLADRIGVSQPRVAAIERSRNVTLDVLEQYVTAVGARLEVKVVKGSRRLPLLIPESKSRGRVAAKMVGARQVAASRARPRSKGSGRARQAGR